MRLTSQEIQIIKSAVYEIMGDNACVWLFGSRVYDNKRGIDLFIEVDLAEARDRIQKKSQLWTKLQFQLGEQRIDIAEPQLKKQRLIEQIAKQTGICL